jgi:hypothetical protein
VTQFNLTPITAVAGAAAIGWVFWVIIGWLERQVGAPIMRERINKGSDKFFADEDRNGGAALLDKVVRLDFGDEDEREEIADPDEPVRLFSRSRPVGKGHPPRPLPPPKSR